MIEDDYDAEFRYDREPVRALQGLRPDGVIYLGTVSKTLAPALRLAWLVLPESLVAEATSTKQLLDDFSPTLEQLAFARMLDRGDYQRHIRKARAVYRARRDRLTNALSEHFPELTVSGVSAGLRRTPRSPRRGRRSRDSSAQPATPASPSQPSPNRPSRPRRTWPIARLRTHPRSAIQPAIATLSAALHPALD